MSSPEELAARLQHITAGLEGYLERRAQELAARIKAEQRAAAAVRSRTESDVTGRRYHRSLA
ncbi:hypothetical protein BG844_27025 [Couchioplanes caeruleus subsp. caeruleus]|uniref:Uncharacterized protein n=2 Tax=Couchioplanes caeruleus TaxID=56438 RepID=A0A1K0FER5_9ACTN|nr:hypothetical protein BG844_27025 [Couchioplanes caeruleus subsp. caeruleus]